MRMVFIMAMIGGLLIAVVAAMQLSPIAGNAAAAIWLGHAVGGDPVNSRAAPLFPQARAAARPSSDPGTNGRNVAPVVTAADA